MILNEVITSTHLFRQCVSLNNAIRKIELISFQAAYADSTSNSPFDYEQHRVVSRRLNISQKSTNKKFLLASMTIEMIWRNVANVQHLE